VGDERRLRVFEHRVFREYLGLRGTMLQGNEENYLMRSLPNIVRMEKSRTMRWAGHVARIGEGRVVHRVLVGKPERKRLVGRPRHRWEDNINMDL
jgi:hypothetical protein